MTASDALAEFLVGLRVDDLPQPVIDAAKQSVLDTIGVALAASDRPWSTACASLASSMGDGGPTTIWGARSTSSPLHAALANGTAAHGIEMDDRVPSAQAHPGSMTVPAAIAMCESRHRTGADLICAVVAGYELGLRVGDAVRLPYGLHYPGHKGVWSAVAAAGRAVRASTTTMVNALGLAGSMASGISAFVDDGSGAMVKRLHGGLASHHGVLAVLLAEQGLTGPSTVLDGEFGYCNVFASEGEPPQLGALTAGLGDSFQVLRRETKPYAAWGGGHLVIDALREIMDGHAIDPDEVVSVEIAGSQRLVRMHDDPAPTSIMAGQYSVPFLVALTLRRGASALASPSTTWTEEVLGDDTLRSDAAKVRVAIDADLDAEARQLRTYGSVQVEVTLLSGQTHRAVVDHSLGTLGNPVTPEQVEAKFRALVEPLGTRARASEIIEVVDELERTDAVERLTALLV